MAVFQPEIVYLTDGSTFSDYRPAIDGTGQTVVFERNLPGFMNPQLCSIQVASPDDYAAFVPSLDAYAQSRPDWNWDTGAVAFNVQQHLKGPLLVYTVGPDGQNPTRVPGIAGMSYPAWASHDGQMTGMYAHGLPGPSNYVFDLEGNLGGSNIDGVWADPDGSQSVTLYGGMPTLSTLGLPAIAFAGQPTDGWNGAFPLGYDQERNYIFANDPGGGTSTPIEAPQAWNSYDKGMQGRAPAWYPDDNRWIIAFESTRGGDGYGIYLYLNQGGSITVTRVTPPGLIAQHAKFFPGGTQLIFSYKPDIQAKNWGLATVDISALLTA